MANSCKRFGMAVIALDLLSVLVWPMTRPPFSEHQAESMCKKEEAVARSKEAVTVLPSRKTRTPWVSWATARVQERKHACKCAGLRRANTRPKVSCEGIPY